MRPVAALVAITLLLLAGPLAGTALAGPGDPTPAAPVGAADPAAPVEATAPGPLVLNLEQLTPRLVTSDGPGFLTVTGTLANIGATPVGELALRVQRGGVLSTDADMRAALDGRGATDAVTPDFVDLAGELAPGASMPIRLDVPLRSTTRTGLGITEPGVYPLLVNVNGVPADGARARLAAVRMLLPVESLPPDPTVPRSTGPGSATPPSRTGSPPAAPFTLLYPIADVPRRLPGVPGEVPTLTDDELAASFTPGGRLYGLVDALARRAPVGSPTRDATCVVVDPDLLQTAAAMREGYQVRGADGDLTPGRGAEAAGTWLDSLVAAARGGCVLAQPFADADLVALTHGGLAAQAAQAVADGREITAATLGTPVLGGALWPADGLLDAATLAAVRAAAPTTGVVLSADGVGQTRTSETSGVRRLDDGTTAVLTDPLLTDAASGPADTDTDSGSGGAGGTVQVTSVPAAASTPLSTQDAIGAVTFRALTRPDSDPDSATAPIVLAPPHRWAAEGTGADALLSTVARLVGDSLLTPRGLATTFTMGPPAAADPEPLYYPVRTGSVEIPAAVVDRVRDLDAEVHGLAAAAQSEPGAEVTPDDVFVPLLRATLRPVSAAWRDRPGLAEAAADDAAGRIDELRSSIRVLEPPGPYSLGTSDAPLLLTVANGLPVAMNVRIELASTAGLRVAPIPEQRVPPLGRLQVRVSAQVVRSGQFAVDATARTAAGQPLGPPTRLHVRSTAYGTITVWLTAVAGVLLVVLVTRRILRRIRGDRRRRSGPADPGPVPADPLPSPPTDPTPPSAPPGAAPPVPTHKG